MKRFLLMVLVAGGLLAMAVFANYWLKTQPIGIAVSNISIDTLQSLPDKNREIVNFIEANGASLAPTYDSVVCTEFVIKAINHFNNLTPQERNLIRIITQDDLMSLIETDSPIIRGVQTALLFNRKGNVIDDFSKVKPGDFVQFWNSYNGSAFGHCGIVHSMEANKSLTVFSSHPLTHGYGKQTFLWPDKVFFVRLN
ncbi:MAG: hypothetical protein JNK18_16480 [Cyclobacteriaceae bacterium]|nr:hypothetical protein [Cyclobacteriaceae bacterium]